MGRERRLVKLADVLPRRLGGTAAPAWSELVGATLGEVSVPVGVDGQGTLRVLALNDAARHELLSRRDHILAAWNAVAKHLGAQPASDLVAWVRADLEIRRPPRPARKVRAAPSPQDVARAEQETAGVADRALARSLTRARARALAHGRETQTALSDSLAPTSGTGAPDGGGGES